MGKRTGQELVFPENVSKMSARNFLDNFSQTIFLENFSQTFFWTIFPFSNFAQPQSKCLLLFLLHTTVENKTFPERRVFSFGLMVRGLS
jgi:hypothetical protein